MADNPLPTWFELFITANGKYQQFDDVEFETPADLFQEADRLVVELKQEMDVGSWEVVLLPHWCDRNGACFCDEQRARTKPYAGFRGMVLPPNFEGKSGREN